jgi:hypothetical protein
VLEHIASAASEAYECQSIGAHRAARSLARAVVEAIAKHKGITQGRLVDKIEEMEQQDLILSPGGQLDWWVREHRPRLEWGVGYGVQTAATDGSKLVIFAAPAAHSHEVNAICGARVTPRR